MPKKQNTSTKKPALKTLKKKTKKPSLEQGGANGTSETVASGVAGYSGEKQQAPHDQDLTWLGMVGKDEGLSEYNFKELTSCDDFSWEQQLFLSRSAERFFNCSAETRLNFFPAFLSYTQRVLYINYYQLHIIAEEHLLKTTEPPNYIFFAGEDGDHTQQQYMMDLITVVEDLNADIISSSGNKKASEFLNKYAFVPVNEFFLKKEQNTHLYFASINKYGGLPFPTEMLKELIAAPEFKTQKNIKPDAHESREQNNKTGLVLTKNSDSTSCSAHCLSMVQYIYAAFVDSLVVELLIDVLSLVIAPREILVYGKDGEEIDAQLIETLVKNIKYTNRLETLTLDGINLTAKSAAIISKSLYKVPNLSWLSLSLNPLSEGLNDLINQLSCVPHLVTLWLNYVMMTKEQVHDLTTAVRHSNISKLWSEYHDKKGNPKPEDEWRSEEDWKRRYPSLFREDDSSENEQDQELNPFTSDDTDAQSHPGQSDSIPAHVQARGKEALAAYRRALETGGSTYDKRVKVLIVGQDRVGKTSLSKSLRGEAFNENEPSTDGVYMMSPVKNAGTEAWRNPPSLERTSVFDHKMAAKVTGELLSTPTKKASSESSIKDVTGDKIQEPTGVASNEAFDKTRENEHPMPSTAGEKEDLGRQDAQIQEAEQKSMTRNQEQVRENQKKPPYVVEEKVDSMSEGCAFLVKEQLEKKEVNQDDKIWPVIWDFAGQDIYRAIHPIFTSSEAIYLLVTNLTKKLSAIAECRVNLEHECSITARDSEDTNFDHLLRWLNLIHSHSVKKDEKLAGRFLHPPVILVGTHADCVVDPSQAMESLEKHCSHVISGEFLKHIRKCFAIDNRQAGKSEDQKNIEALRQEILELADKMPHTKDKIPLQWHLVEKEISEPTWQRKKYLRKKTFQEYIVSKFINDKKDFDQVIYFLRDRGTIVYPKDTSEKDGLVILDPQWLIDIICKIIKVKLPRELPLFLRSHGQKLRKEGILSRELIDHVCENQKIDNIKRSLISLMEEFNLICAWPAKENEDSVYLVPCMLTTKGKGEIAVNEMTAPVYLTFKGTKYVPGGLFSQLVVLFGRWLSDPKYPNEYKLYANEALFALDRVFSLHLVCYKTVIKLYISTEEPKHTPPDEYYEDVLSHLQKSLATLQEECRWLRSMSVELCARCTKCLGKNANPCPQHEKEGCRHHDCSHYIPLEANLCCKPGDPLPREPLQPWITASEKLNLSPRSHGAAKKVPWQSGLEKPTKHKSQVTFGHTLCYLQRMQADAKQVPSKTDPLVKLKTIASDKGFIVSDNQGSGNCMFHALSEQLAVVKGIRISHEKLRQSIVEYLKDDHTLPDGTKLFNFVLGYSSWDTYLTNMAADGTWGDHVILHGAANCFRTYIHVISSLSHQHDLIISPGCEVDSSNRLVLGHVHELHYVSLIEPKRGTITKDGVVTDDDLEGLSLKLGNSWTSVARRLNFSKAEITAFRNQNDEYSEKVFSMLERWKEKTGSKATYRVLYDALCHEYVDRKDLAQDFCT